MSIDTFVGLPLNQSIANTAWDSGDITWAAKTFLVGDGNGWVKSTQTSSFQGIANFNALDGQLGQAAYFKVLAGRNTGAPAFGIYIDSDGSLDEYSPGRGVRAWVGEYGTLKLREMGPAGTTAADQEVACSLTNDTEYYLEIFKTSDASGRQYRANVYDAPGGVKAATVKATQTITLNTALASTNKRANFFAAGSNHPYILIRQVETAQAAASDTTAPTLSNASATPSSTSVGGSISTNEGNGTLYYLVNTTASPTAATVKGGNAQAVSASGLQNVSVNGLLASSAYYLHFLHRDAAGNDSAITSVSFSTTAGGADMTAPTLSSPTGTPTSSSTATGTVSTDEGGGTLYYVASANSSEGAATVKAGGTQTVSATGLQTVYLTGLTSGTTRYIHFLHRDAAGNDSAVSTSPSFTMPAADTTVPTFAGGAAITAGTITSSSVAFNWPAASDNVGVAGYQISKDGGTTWVDNGTGLSGQFTGLTAATAYPIRVRALDAAGNVSEPLTLTMTTSGASTGTFVTDQWVSSGTLRANQAFTGTWYSGGAPGTAGGTATLVSGTLSATATATITVPKGTGFFIGATSDGGRYYQEGTVA